MKKYLIGIWRKFLCAIGDHDWTCKAEQGIKPTNEELAVPFVGFQIYSAMYCKHCKRISDLSINAMNWKK